MSSARATERVRLLLATARKNPEFAGRLLQGLPEELRGPMLSELAQPPKAMKRDGLRKTKPQANPYAYENGLSAQLSFFARQVSKVS